MQTTKENKTITFGDYIEGKNFKVLDERALRASAGIMFLLAIIAFINGFILQNFIAITYISGFLMLNFIIGIFINPKFSPTMLIAKSVVENQTALPIGAIQKKFAWFLGLILSVTIFILSIFLLNDPTLFEPVCFLCLICLSLLYIETAFGICVGCKLYYLFIRLKIIKQAAEKPNCMGNSCDID